MVIECICVPVDGMGRAERRERGNSGGWTRDAGGERGRSSAIANGWVVGWTSRTVSCLTGWLLAWRWECGELRGQGEG